MDPVIANFVAPLVGIVVIGNMVLIGMKMRYSYLRRTRVGSVTTEDMERLRDAVDSVRDEVQSMKEELHRLDDRVEFAERLLERPKPAEGGSDPSRPPPPSPRAAPGRAGAEGGEDRVQRASLARADR